MTPGAYDYLFLESSPEPAPKAWLDDLLATPINDDPSFVMHEAD